MKATSLPDGLVENLMCCSRRIAAKMKDNFRFRVRFLST